MKRPVLLSKCCEGERSAGMCVKTEENPADLASRGVSPDDLKRLHFWLDGPYFLLHSNITYVTPSDTNEDDVTA